MTPLQHSPVARGPWGPPQRSRKGERLTETQKQLGRMPAWAPGGKRPAPPTLRADAKRSGESDCVPQALGSHPL
eukprot:5898542-Pyramimonas_sp.AAC.1